ncbi:hypothetical protein BDQ12DRAFT_694527 [Crucibulum laeve]|uniref:Uncharacterized protein n=1 Tax=Crucibulum laeve TaxID=68775 RepID=A0A5C3LEH3_9AGAR|nr:hypothetical protein BDQ12DRAFT_694527 [Crucibulum laeve]
MKVTSALLFPAIALYITVHGVCLVAWMAYFELVDVLRIPVLAYLHNALPASVNWFFVRMD